MWGNLVSQMKKSQCTQLNLSRAWFLMPFMLKTAIALKITT